MMPPRDSGRGSPLRNPQSPLRNLRESHAHIAAHGQAMSMVRCEPCASADDFLSLLARATSEREPGEWLLAGGVRVEGWREPAWPALRRLDDATGNRPACAWSFDYHALLLNSAAMRALAIAADVPDPPHGRILRDERGGPTGVMLEAAAKSAWSRIPEPGLALRKRHILGALEDLASHGFTEIDDLLSPPWLGPLLGEIEREGRLRARVRLYPALADLEATLARRDRWESDLLTLEGAKLFADGTLNSRTAWMLEPYADPLPGLLRGQPMLTREDLSSAMHRLWSQGLALAVHAIGDGAVRAVLDAYQGARASMPSSAASRAEPPIPLRIEHAEVIDPADTPRFARLGVVASVQPCHLLADIEVLRRQLPHRLDRVFPLRELIDSGCAPGDLLRFGSDTPIVRPQPQDSILVSVHRRREGTPRAEAIAPEQAILEAEAWAAFATGVSPASPR